MGISLSDKTIRRIAEEVVRILEMRQSVYGGGASVLEPEYVTTSEAARILGISADRVRHIKDRLPHIKMGDDERGRLLFRRDTLLSAYMACED